MCATSDRRRGPGPGPRDARTGQGDPSWSAVAAEVGDQRRRVLGPGVLRIAADELLAQRRVVLDPEAGQIRRDLDGALVGGEQVEDQRDAAVADGGGASEAEEVLHARGDPGRLIEGVVDRGATAAG